MTIHRQSRTVWVSDDSLTELLVGKSIGEYYIPLSTIKFETLCELALAIEDAILRAGGSERTAVGLGDAARKASPTSAEGLRAES